MEHFISSRTGSPFLLQFNHQFRIGLPALGVVDLAYVLLLPLDPVEHGFVGFSLFSFWHRKTSSELAR
jgi:hypothetical protein